MAAAISKSNAGTKAGNDAIERALIELEQIGSLAETIAKKAADDEDRQLLTLANLITEKTASIEAKIRR